MKDNNTAPRDKANDGFISRMANRAYNFITKGRGVTTAANKMENKNLAPRDKVNDTFISRMANMPNRAYNAIKKQLTRAKNNLKEDRGVTTAMTLARNNAKESLGQASKAIGDKSMGAARMAFNTPGALRIAYNQRRQNLAQKVLEGKGEKLNQATIKLDALKNDYKNKIDPLKSERDKAGYKLFNASKPRKGIISNISAYFEKRRALKEINKIDKKIKKTETKYKPLIYKATTEQKIAQNKVDIALKTLNNQIVKGDELKARTATKDNFKEKVAAYFSPTPTPPVQKAQGQGQGLGG